MPLYGTLVKKRDLLHMLYYHNLALVAKKLI